MSAVAVTSGLLMTSIAAAAVAALVPAALVAAPPLAPQVPGTPLERGSDHDVVRPPPGLDRFLPATEGEVVTTAAASLGRRLFFDPRLSRDHSISCASCHRPDLAFTDGRRVARGVDARQGNRNVPTLVNRGYGVAHSWDGRVESLREQALAPIANPLEMDLPVEKAVARIREVPEYRAGFDAALGEDVSTSSLARALAAFLASIFSGDAPVDRYMAGDTMVLSADARLGRRLFRGRAGCAACHTGPNHTDEAFHNTGVAWRGGAPADSGRFHVTGDPRHVGAFKTPTLREVARTAPYMHDGSFASLEEVIDFYDAGGHPNPHLAPRIRPLGLSRKEKDALVAYLEGLSGTIQASGHP